jgi:hypothetical protein
MIWYVTARNPAMEGLININIINDSLSVKGRISSGVTLPVSPRKRFQTD